MPVPSMPTWEQDPAPPGKWRTDRLSWITTAELTSTYGIDTSEMVSDETSWTQVA
jgi:hypothetical protein